MRGYCDISSGMLIDFGFTTKRPIMKSKASVKSHPIHPMLVAFPIAFFTGALLFDVMAVTVGNDSFWRTGSYLEAAGIVAAIAAAVPGAIDYFGTVPPRSSAKQRATKHALLNITMLVLFVIAFIVREERDHMPFLIIGLELTGFILMGFAGWLGGTLVYRNQIGVDPRYAQAGKWKEVYLDGKNGAVMVAEESELKVNQMKLVHLHDQRIVIGRTEDGYVAFADRCTHRGGSLAGGAMICGTVQCPWHGSQFDTRSGAVKAGPAKEAITVYPLTLSNGKIYLNSHDIQHSHQKSI